jgi:DNA-binding protein HU-beta
MAIFPSKALLRCGILASNRRRWYRETAKSPENARFVRIPLLFLWLKCPRIAYGFALEVLLANANARNRKGGRAAMATTNEKPTTVTLKHIAAKLAEKHEMPKKQAETLLNDLVDTIVGHLKKGERIRMVGLGILQVRKRAARMGRNPATGEPIQIKASKKVAFRASKELKEAV